MNLGAMQSYNPSSYQKKERGRNVYLVIPEFINQENSDNNQVYILKNVRNQRRIAYQSRKFR
jgi:hypothetical protein